MAENNAESKKTKYSVDDMNAETITGQLCPMCGKNALTLTETTREIPFFGNAYIFSMLCEECRYFKSDIETDNDGNPTKYVLEVESEEDMKIRVIKSSFATVKIGRVGTIEPGTAANGYISNVEGVLNRMKRQIEHIRDTTDDKTQRKKAKNMIKKLQNVIWGNDKIKITIEDPSGNSAIISEKVKKSKLRVKD